MTETGTRRPAQPERGLPAQPATYYGRPVLKPPVWKPSVPLYFFMGGLAGASAGLALVARLGGNATLARRCTLSAGAAVAVCPLLLIEDLGRPERFHHMFRVAKPTSPMSVGTWLLAAFGAAASAAAASQVTGVARPLGRWAAALAGVLGLPLTTYTAALVANTSIPAWRRARRVLPFLFAAGSATSAGALATLTTPARAAGPARRLAVGGAVAEVAMSRLMIRVLGDDAAPYLTGSAARWRRLAEPLALAGAAGVLAGRWSRTAGSAGAAALLAGALAERVAVWRAGPDSATGTLS